MTRLQLTRLTFLKGDMKWDKSGLIWDVSLLCVFIKERTSHKIESPQHLPPHELPHSEPTVNMFDNFKKYFASTNEKKSQH